eukprot:gb/GFBE01027942.1/.p1 GENE.gb/GFBE01027942.1/~~gb/GFBE01027942.1/.p1  ORF type:complete len:386 (+),score=87.27 gb/GFBE01027942.1/:1-1158(+)
MPQAPIEVALLFLAAFTIARCSKWEEDLDATLSHVQLLQHAAAVKNRGEFTVWLPSGPQQRDSNDTFYHVHIPKVAGLSFGLDALDLLSVAERRMISREGCHDSPGLPDAPTRDRMVLLRSPPAHVLSMYNFCKYATGPKQFVEELNQRYNVDLPETFGDWVHNWTEITSGGWAGDFTSTQAAVGPVEKAYREMRTAAWSKPPWALPPQEDLTNVNFVQLDGGGTLWHFVDIPFNCYAPMNFQSQRMTCTKAMEWPEEVDVDLAVRKMEETFHVGIIEAYQASICVLHAKVSNKLPPYCDCTDAEKWASFTGHEDNVNEEGTNDPNKVRHAADISPDLRILVDDFTKADQKLFTAGWARLVREARWVEAQHGIKVLCDETQPSFY